MCLRVIVKTIFEGVWVPIITPFHEGRIDQKALFNLAQHFAKNKIAGLVACGTTGEGSLLTSGEVEDVFTTLRDAVPAMPVVLGLSEVSTQAAVCAAKHLASFKPEGLLVTAPIYMRPSQKGVQHHFEAIVEAADLPILIYNIPYRAGVAVEIETLQSLAEDPRVVGIKECGGGADRIQRLLHETSLRVLSGDDGQNFVALCLGAHGTISAAAHIFPELHVRVFNLLRDNQLSSARRIASALSPIIRDLFEEPNPAPLKTLLAERGWCEAEVRLPLTSISAKLISRLMADWSLLESFDSLNSEN
jgi:4-hydroxy-tetrahydrodipicolinate synthase